MKVMKDSAPSRLDELALELAHAREQRKEWEAREESARRAFIRETEAAGKSSVTASDGTHNIKVSVVPQTRLDWDEDKLKKIVGSSMWTKISKRVLDKDKLEAKVVEGALDPNELAQAASERVVHTVRTSLKKLPPEDE